MLSQRKSSVPSLDSSSRSSTGIFTPPLIPVDDDGQSGGRSIARGATLPERETVGSGDKAPTSLELLRQLEACVRELLEISAHG
jgi:hypothetical protein